MLNSIDQATLSRLRVVVAAGQSASPDLARAALVALEATASKEDRLTERDRHIRLAAVLINGTAWERAKYLKKEADVITRIWSRLRDKAPEKMSVRGELHAAKLLHDLPSATAQFYNIIQY